MPHGFVVIRADGALKAAGNPFDRGPQLPGLEQVSKLALVEDPGRTLERKVKEIVQSIRLTEAYPGVTGKQKIIAAYLNQNYYGNQAYGIKAAAQSYFNKSLADLTPAEIDALMRLLAKTKASTRRAIDKGAAR